MNTHINVEQTKERRFTNEERAAFDRMTGLLRRSVVDHSYEGGPPPYTTFFAYDGEKIVGMMSLLFPAGGGEINLSHVYVLKRWRRRGVGKALVRAVLASFDQGRQDIQASAERELNDEEDHFNYDLFFVYVHAANVVAQQFFQSVGFAPCWEEHGFEVMGYPCKKWLLPNYGLSGGKSVSWRCCARYHPVI